jgi:hypothetical protein
MLNRTTTQVVGELNLQLALVEAQKQFRLCELEYHVLQEILGADTISLNPQEIVSQMTDVVCNVYREATWEHSRRSISEEVLEALVADLRNHLESNNPALIAKLTNKSRRELQNLLTRVSISLDSAFEQQMPIAEQLTTLASQQPVISPSSNRVNLARLPSSPNSAMRH